MLKIYKIVAWSQYAHDGILDTNFNHIEKLTSDDEPTPVCIDPWARGTVQTKLPVEDDAIYARRNSTVGSQALSVSSYRSSNNGKNCAAKKTSSSGGSRAGGNKGNIPGSQDTTGYVWNLDGDYDADYNNLPSTGQMFDLLQKSKRSKQKDQTQEVEIKDEFENVREGIKKAVKNIKGKRYVIDKDGVINPVQAVRPENLPPFTVALGLSITSEMGVPEKGSKEKKEKNDDASKKKQRKTVRVAGSRTVDEALFKPSNTLATSMTGDSILSLVSPGVAVSVDGELKCKPPTVDDPKHCSRQNYFDKRSVLLDPAIGLSQPSQQSATDSTVTRHSSLFKSSTSSAPPLTAPPTALQPVKFPDIDVFEGGKKVLPAPPPPVPAQQTSEAFGLRAKTNSFIATVVPKKPNPRQHQTIALMYGGKDKALPRDRDGPLAMVPQSERKKLAAPPAGSITGQGSMYESLDELSLGEPSLNRVEGGRIRSEMADLTRQLFH